MSYSWRKVIGFLLFIGVVIPMALFSMGTALLGRCDSDGHCMTIVSYSLLFPGLLLGAIFGTVLLVKWAVKDDY